MGDAALHMREMFRQSYLEVPEEFRSTPDHLVLELEFLSLLYNCATQEQVQRFITDHLDWIPDLKEQVDRANAHPFYRNAVELINLFLVHESKEGKAKSYGPKNFH
jgi:TorA maturation chaperone TorD